MLPPIDHQSSSMTTTSMISEPLLGAQSSSSSSSSSSCDEGERQQVSSFLKKAKSFLRYKMLLTGFLFGCMLESLIAMKASLEFIERQQLQQLKSGIGDELSVSTTDAGTSTTTAADSVTPLLEKEETYDAATAEGQSFLVKCMWYELNFLYVDVLFVIYVALLVRSHFVNARVSGNPRVRGADVGRIHCGMTRTTNNTGPDISLVVMASNWAVGMVLGAMFLVGALFGRRAIFPLQILRMLLTIVLAIATCVLARESILQIFVMISGEDEEDRDTGGDESADDVEFSSSKKGEPQGGYFVAQVV